MNIYMCHIHIKMHVLFNYVLFTDFSSMRFDAAIDTFTISTFQSSVTFNNLTSFLKCCVYKRFSGLESCNLIGFNICSNTPFFIKSIEASYTLTDCYYSDQDGLHY